MSHQNIYPLGLTHANIALMSHTQMISNKNSAQKAHSTSPISTLKLKPGNTFTFKASQNQGDPQEAGKKPDPWNLCNSEKSRDNKNMLFTSPKSTLKRKPGNAFIFEARYKSGAKHHHALPHYHQNHDSDKRAYVENTSREDHAAHSRNCPPVLGGDAGVGEGRRQLGWSTGPIG